MPEHPFDDGLGPDPLDRGSSKPLSTGGGSGSFMDPAYEDALHILGRGQLTPSPLAQHALMMTDAEATDLAARLTALRHAAGISRTTLQPESESGPSVQAFIRALQEPAPDPQQLQALQQQIVASDPTLAKPLAEVCAHPGVATKLTT